MPPVAKKILLAVFVPVLLLAAVEGLLRISPWNQELGPQRYHGGRGDHVLFWKPGATVQFPHYNARVDNELRGSNPTMPKPADLYRIVALGGSVTYGCPHDDHPSWAFPARMEHYLNAAGVPRKVEVLNGGVGGYTSFQALYYFRERLRRYKPDMLVLCFAANDGNDNLEVGLDITDKAYHQHLKALVSQKEVFALRQALDHLRLFALVEDTALWVRAALVTPTPRVPREHFVENMSAFVAMAREDGFKVVFLPEVADNMTSFAQEVEHNPYFSTMAEMAKKNKDIAVLGDYLTPTERHPTKEIFLDAVHLTRKGYDLMGKAAAEAALRTGWIGK